MTDHDHADDDAAVLARQLAELEAEGRAELEADPELAEVVARRLPARHDPGELPPAHHALALVTAAEAAGAPVGEGRFVWRTTRRLVVDVDGLPAGIVEHRTLGFTNTRPGLP